MNTSAKHVSTDTCIPAGMWILATASPGDVWEDDKDVPLTRAELDIFVNVINNRRKMDGYALNLVPLWINHQPNSEYVHKKISIGYIWYAKKNILYVV